MIYTSVDNKKIKDIKKLNTKKYRDKTNLFLVEGRHLVLEAYKRGYLQTLILEENEIFPLDVDTMYVSNNVINYISTLETPQLVMGLCKKIEEKEIGSKILILDDIQDPGNLGTIIRSAVAFNVDTIIASPNTVDIYNPKVIRASQGMIFHINYIIDDLYDRVKYLKQNNYKILGTNVNDGKSLKNVEKIKKFAIIMGNEGNGVRPELQNLSDELLYIDMNNNCESLNVAVATSIILYELSK